MVIRVGPLVPLLLLLLAPLGWRLEAAMTVASRPTPFVLERRCLDWHTTPRTTICGRFYVREVRGDPESPVISMPFVVLRAPGAGRHPDPVILIDGGPGGPSWAQARPNDDWHWVFQNYSWLSARDFVLMNQRGVGERATPSLNCPEVLELLPQVFEISPWRRALRECRARLEAEGVQLGAYNTTAIADDHIELLHELGYRQYNIWGPSYGSRVAQVVMRRDTERVRSAILEGVYPVDAPDDWEWERFFAAAIYRLLDSCATRPACEEAYPDLRQDMRAVLAGLRRSPVSIATRLPGSGETVRYSIDDRAFLDMLSSLLYGRDWLSYLPLLLNRMQQADKREAEVRQLLENFLRKTLDAYSGEAMASMINCTERGDVPSEGNVDALARLYPAMGPWIRWRNSQDGCEDWPTESERPLDRTPVSVDIPVLLLAGRYDFATPEEWARRVAANLPNARLYIFTTGHYVSGEECAGLIMTAFFADPDAGSPDCNTAPPLLFDLPE
jgi:pimeloyl-ACP methyl ester carboxylesterase